MTTFRIQTITFYGGSTAEGGCASCSWDMQPLCPGAVTGDTLETPMLATDIAPRKIITARLFVYPDYVNVSAVAIYGSMDGVSGWTSIGSSATSVTVPVGSYKFIKGVATLNVPGGISPAKIGMNLTNT